MKKVFLKTGLAICLIGTLLSCNNSAADQQNEEAMTDTTTTNADTGSEWVSLFDGHSQAGWHGYNKPPGDMPNWTIEDSALVCLGAAKEANGGDIVTDNDYENFELTFDWKVTTGANSGVMYHVIEDPKYQVPYETGPEYQVIDDVGFPGKLQEGQKAAADYDMHFPNDKKKLMPVGEWNTAKILFSNGHAEHWLNGEKVVEFQAWNDDWNKRREASKWKDYPRYGLAKKGKIALQDHGNKVYYRNIKIREIISPNY